MSRKDWAHHWGQMSDNELESAARYYLWLAKSFPDLRTQRLEEIVAEVSRRGKPEIMEQAKASIQRGQASGTPR